MVFPDNVFWGPDGRGGASGFRAGLSAAERDRGRAAGTALDESAVATYASDRFTELDDAGERLLNRESIDNHEAVCDLCTRFTGVTCGALRPRD